MALNWFRTFAITLVLSQQILAEVLIKNENNTQSVHHHHIDHNNNSSNQHINTNGDLDLSNQSSKSDRTSLTSSTPSSSSPSSSSPSSSAKHLHINNNQHYNSTKFLRLEDVLDIFNIEELALIWNNVDKEFHENCSRDMHQYFIGLNMHKIWAVKSKYCNFGAINLILPILIYKVKQNGKLIQFLKRARKNTEQRQ